MGNFAAGSTAGVTASADKVFQLNSLYSPEYSGGHQPYGFDQLCASASTGSPYAKYKVLGVKVKITFFNPSGAAPLRYCSAVGVYNPAIANVAGQNLQTKAINELAEKANVRVEFVPTSGNQQSIQEINFPSLHTAYELTKDAFDVEMSNTAADYNQSPGLKLWLQINAADIATASNTCGYKVELTFKSLFFSRNMLPTS